MAAAAAVPIAAVAVPVILAAIPAAIEFAEKYGPKFTEKIVKHAPQLQSAVLKIAKSIDLHKIKDSVSSVIKHTKNFLFHFKNSSNTNITKTDQIKQDITMSIFEKLNDAEKLHISEKLTKGTPEEVAQILAKFVDIANQISTAKGHGSLFYSSYNRCGYGIVRGKKSQKKKTTSKRKKTKKGKYKENSFRWWVFEFLFDYTSDDRGYSHKNNGELDTIFLYKWMGNLREKYRKQIQKFEKKFIENVARNLKHYSGYDVDTKKWIRRITVPPSNEYKGNLVFK